MRRGLLFIIFSCCPALSYAQEFTSPIDVVSTLYGTYFLNVPLTDIRPYFSDELTGQLGSTVIGQEQFRRSGFDPLTSQLDWDPRGFALTLVRQNASTAVVLARFTEDSKAVTVSFELIKEVEHGWQIDHIEGTAGDQTWCTNAIVSLAQP
jgi:hypothetical protein